MGDEWWEEQGKWVTSLKSHKNAISLLGHFVRTIKVLHIIIIISCRLLVQKVDMLRCRPSNNICPLQLS